MTPSTVAPAAAERHSAWIGITLFVAGLLLNGWFFVQGWDDTLMGEHQFRQAQTAITTQGFVENGFSLKYATPLLGPPWEIPLEFPLFQGTAAIVAKATGLTLDAAGRFTSWIYFLAGLPAAFLLLARFGLSFGHRLVVLALLLVSPLYLYVSQLFLIESTATTLSLWFLLAASCVIDRRPKSWLALAWICGALAAGVKITTWFVFLVAFALILIGRWRGNRGAGPAGIRSDVFRLALIVVPPAIAGMLWVAYAKSVRDLNPEAHFLNSHFGAWTFGTPGLRFTAEYWITTFQVWVDSLVSEVGLVLLAAYAACLRGRLRWAVAGSLLAFLSGQLVFANLYFVHNYYFYANGLFLVAAVGFALVEFLEHPRAGEPHALLLGGSAMVLFLSAFSRSHLTEFQRPQPVPQVAELLASVSTDDEVFVTIGMDWEGSIPYYARRKALMILNGREHDPANVRRSVERLDPHKIAGVLIWGRQRRDIVLVRQAFPQLDLGDEPLVYDSSNFALWVPRARHEQLRAAFSHARFSDFNLAAGRAAAARPTSLDARAAMRRPEFTSFNPRPVSARSDSGFAPTLIDGAPMAMTHARTELTFDVPAGARGLTAVFGLEDSSYTNGNLSDGIELTVHLRAGGEDSLLFSRVLDPASRATDRGQQKLDVDLPVVVGGQLVIRVGGGPSGNITYDWAYLGQLRIE